MKSVPRFPPGFLWGASTAAYQVEGSPLADGAGQSIWHRFSHTPGRVTNGDTGDLACDHYRRYESDVRLMQELGLGAYRFSMSWSRILPLGKGRVNQPGLAFYDRLVDALLERGIAPLITLFHWDLPAALDDLGGWLNRDIADWFAEYARVAGRALGDRVPMWATLNEPHVVSDGGYLWGGLAPGHRNLFEPPIAAHNLLRAHGSAVQALRAECKSEVGIVVNLEPKYPASDDPLDVAATRRADAYMNRHYLDPIFRGEYPAELREIFGEAWNEPDPDDFRVIGEPLDFLGVNYYSRGVTKHAPDEPPVRAVKVKQRRRIHTEMGWEAYAPGLTDTLEWVKLQYGDIPLYVTENGAAFRDPPTASEGIVHDPRRVAFLRAHLRAAHDAIARGVDLRGYFVWSLLDNFEWSHGYTKRFGIVHVDFRTQKRTLKSSARFYSEVIRSQGAAIGG